MTSSIIKVLIILIAISSLQSSPLNSDLYPPDIFVIKDRDTLVVAQFSGEREGFFADDSDNRLPDIFHYDSDGEKLIGFDIELAHLLATELDVELRIDRHYESFNNVAYAVAQGDADLAISKLSVTSERAQFLNYSTPYLSLKMTMLIHRMNESSIGESRTNPLFACESEGVSIGVLDNSSFVGHGKRLFPKAEIIGYPDQSSLFDAVKRGEILAILYEEYEIGKYMRKQPDLPIYCHTVELPGRSDDIAIAVAGENVTLLGFIETIITKENIHPTVQEIIENFIPEEDLVTDHEKVELKLNDPALVMALIISILMILFWFSLSRKSSAVKGVK